MLNIDFVPTWVELTGARAERTMDGMSLVPLLRGTPPTPGQWRQDFLVEIYSAVEQIRAVRSAQWIYAESTVSGERQLYDLRADPYELESLHDSAPMDTIEQLSNRLHELSECAGDTCSGPIGCCQQRTQLIPGR